jgi:hypothetical protein
METQRGQIKVVLPWLVPRVVVLVQEILFCLGFSRRHKTKYFFLIVHYFNSFDPIGQQDGQAVVLGSQSLSVCL